MTKSHNGQKAWNILRTSQSQTIYVLTMGHGSTLNLSRILQQPSLHTSSLTQTPDGALQSNSLSSHHVTRQDILQYTYWLTMRHSGDFRDIPLIQVPVEGGTAIRTTKHCRKKKKADYIHKSTRNKRKAKHNINQNTRTANSRQTLFTLHTQSFHQPKPHPGELPWISIAYSGHDTSSSLNKQSTVYTSHHHQQPKAPDGTLQSLQHEFTPRQVILHYTYWLTKRSIGNCGNIPLMQVSVEGFITSKHCRKKRRPIIFTVDA
jgi:hypothetical protein